MKIIIPFFPILFSFIQLAAQSKHPSVSLDLSIRYRFEKWDGMNAKNYGDDGEGAIGELDDSILFQRFIAGFFWRPSGNWVVSAHLQDSRAFGWSLRNSMHPGLFRVRQGGTGEPYYTMNPNEAFFEIHDAFIEYSKLFDRITLTLGRQKISYGDNRIFGPGEWGNTGRWTWDALRLSYVKDHHFIDLFAGGTKVHDPVTPSIPFTRTEYWGGGIYGHIDMPAIVHIEPFYVLKRQGSADYISGLHIRRHWSGIRIFNNDFQSFVIDATMVRQFGKEEGKSIRAYGFFGKLGYRFDRLRCKPLISIRETYASGNSVEDNIIRQFEPAFGANDRYYGRMNIIRWSNIDNREVMLELSLAPGLRLELNYNWFYVPEPSGVVYLGTLKMQDGKNHLGDEVNMYIQYQPVKRWQLTGVFGYFMPGSVHDIGGDRAGNASWFAAQVLFTL